MGKRSRRKREQGRRTGESRPSHLLKLDHALGHLDRLDREIRGFLKSDACRVIEEIDTETGEWVLKVRLTKQPDPALSLLVGDCVHNMRSALDHIAYELSSNYTKSLSDSEAQRSEFPIFNRRSKFHARTKKGDPVRTSGLGKIEAVDPAAQAAIEAMQPYRGGDWLWLMLLQELDRIDKHRRLNLVVATAMQTTVTWAKGVPIKLMRPPGPVEDGTELIRIPFDPAQHVKPKATTAFEVAFGEGQGPGGRAWVVANLRRIERLIRERVIPPLARFL